MCVGMSRWREVKDARMRMRRCTSHVHARRDASVTLIVTRARSSHRGPAIVCPRSPPSPFPAAARYPCSVPRPRHPSYPCLHRRSWRPSRSRRPRRPYCRCAASSPAPPRLHVALPGRDRERSWGGASVDFVLATRRCVRPPKWLRSSLTT
jgi:hypothetical protein